MNLKAIQWRSEPEAGAALPAWIAGLPVHRLAQSFEHETRPRNLRLVLILAPERELRRARRIRAMRLGSIVAVAVISFGLMAPRIPSARSLSIRPAARIGSTLSERLEPRAIASPALQPLQPARLRLDEGLRRAIDRGY